MTTSTLRYNGTARQARENLGRLLREFPQAFFREREATEYEVTADPTTMQKLGTLPGWSLAATH